MDEPTELDLERYRHEAEMDAFKESLEPMKAHQLYYWEMVRALTDGTLVVNFTHDDDDRVVITLPRRNWNVLAPHITRGENHANHG